MGHSQLSISSQDLEQLIGGAGCPVIFDVRRRPAFEAAARVLPTATWCAHDEIEAAGLPADRPIVVYCVHGHEVSRSAAALLGARGHDARYLAGGIEGYVEGGGATIRRPQPEDRADRWVMPGRPSAAVLAAAWLLLRFVVRDAAILFVEPELAAAVARETQAALFGLRDGDLVDLPALLERYEIEQAALRRLAAVIGGGDAKGPGLFAMIEGLSEVQSDDQALLAAALPLFDALYAWCRREGSDG